MTIGNDTTIESSLEEEQRGFDDADNEMDSLLNCLGVHHDIPNYYGTRPGQRFDNFEGDYADGQSFNDDRDYDEYTITDPDENLDILEEEDEDEDADEGDFHQEPGVIEPSPDVYYSTLPMYFKQSFNVIKQPFKELKKQTQLCHFISPVLPYT